MNELVEIKKRKTTIDWIGNSEGRILFVSLKEKNNTYIPEAFLYDSNTKKIIDCVPFSASETLKKNKSDEIAAEKPHDFFWFSMNAGNNNVRNFRVKISELNDNIKQVLFDETKIFGSFTDNETKRFFESNFYYVGVSRMKLVNGSDYAAISENESGFYVENPFESSTRRFSSNCSNVIIDNRIEEKILDSSEDEVSKVVEEKDFVSAEFSETDSSYVLSYVCQDESEISSTDRFMSISWDLAMLFLKKGFFIKTNNGEVKHWTEIDKIINVYEAYEKLNKLEFAV